jgi:protein SCO1
MHFLAALRWATLILCAVLANGASRAQPVALADVRLQDHRGKTLAARDLGDRLVLLNFVFTQCSTSCPLQVRELAALYDQFTPAVRARLRFVSISVDPLSDTPATLAAFARRMDAERAGWHFATGSPTEVGRLLDRMQVFNPAKGTAARAEDHRTSLYLFGPDGQLVQRYAGVPVDASRLTDEISRLALARPAR